MKKLLVLMLLLFAVTGTGCSLIIEGIGSLNTTYDKYNPENCLEGTTLVDGWYVNERGTKIAYQNTVKPEYLSEEEKAKRLEQLKKEIAEEDFLLNSAKYFKEEDVIPKTDVDIDIHTIDYKEFIEMFWNTLDAKIEAKDENMYAENGPAGIMEGYIKGIGNVYARNFYLCNGNYRGANLGTNVNVANKYYIRGNGEDLYKKDFKIYVADKDFAKYSLGMEGEIQYDYFEREYIAYRTDREAFTDTYESVEKLPNGMYEYEDTYYDYEPVIAEVRVEGGQYGKRKGEDFGRCYTLNVGCHKILTNFQDLWVYDRTEYYFGTHANLRMTRENHDGKKYFYWFGGGYNYQGAFEREGSKETEVIPLYDFNKQINANLYSFCQFTDSYSWHKNEGWDYGLRNSFATTYTIFENGVVDFKKFEVTEKYEWRYTNNNYLEPIYDINFPSHLSFTKYFRNA